MKKVQEYNQKVRSSKKMPQIQAGDVVKVHRKIKEGDKERTQVFEGIVIAIKGGQSSSPMVTVRKVSFGVGVEITIPLYSPVIEKIEIVRKTKTRRAKLYFLREKDFKLSKLKTKEIGQFAEEKSSEEKIEEEKKPLEEKKESELKKDNSEKK